MADRTVHVVPHTHWDREWYRPYQAFRLRLVELLDDLLPRLASDPSYAHFMLDGQMAVVDDYLEVRPEAEATIRRLAASGRISVGPWYILVDEFLVSGETMVRDLQLGLAKAAEYGGAMEVGYLPDMFGHVAQMPQILAQAGFDHTVVWRGVPRALDAEAFWWEAPDGTRVRATYLPRGYGNGAVVPDTGKELLERIDTFCQEQGPLAGDPVLWMNGTDHQMPVAHLGRVVDEANAEGAGYQLEVTSLAAHVRAGRTEGLPTIRGELRSGARSNLLMGVASNRVDVHQAEARTTLALERVAEPLCALYLPAEQWPDRLLGLAWREVIRNAAHDSICACSVDEVGRAVIHRFDEARTIAEALTEQVLGHLAAAVGGTGSIVVNPTNRARGGVVEVALPGAEPVPGTQQVSARPDRLVAAEVTVGSLEEVVVGACEGNPRIWAVESAVADDGVVEGIIRADSPGAKSVSLPEARRVVRDAVAGRGAEEPARLVYVAPAGQRALVRVDDVAGFGWQRVVAEPAPRVAPVVAGEASLTNGILTVEVDTEDGTWSVNGQPGFGRLVDDGDQGDTYNWCPPVDDVVVDRPERVEVVCTEHGPLRGRLVIGATYRWPAHVEGTTRVAERDVEVLTNLELRAGEDLLRVTHRIDNRCRDHRVRAWFPLPEATDHSEADSAFAVVERGLTAEGGPNEVGLPTFPSRRFVRAGGLTVAHDGLLEYELVDVTGDGDGARAGALALTLLRCTGLISQGPMWTRPMPAGPRIGTEDAQLPGPREVSYCLHLGDRDPFAVADDAFVPLLVARLPRGGRDDAAESEAVTEAPLAVRGAEVSALQRADGRLSVRVFNPSGAATTVDLGGRSGWLVDLRGRAQERVDGSFPLRPHGIATVVLD